MYTRESVHPSHSIQKASDGRNPTITGSTDLFVWWDQKYAGAYVFEDIPDGTKDALNKTESAQYIKIYKKFKFDASKSNAKYSAAASKIQPATYLHRTLIAY